MEAEVAKTQENEEIAESGIVESLENIATEISDVQATISSVDENIDKIADATQSDAKSDAEVDKSEEKMDCDDSTNIDLSKDVAISESAGLEVNQSQINENIEASGDLMEVVNTINEGIDKEIIESSDVSEKIVDMEVTDSIDTRGDKVDKIDDSLDANDKVADTVDLLDDTIDAKEATNSVSGDKQVDAEETTNDKNDKIDDKETINPLDVNVKVDNKDLMDENKETVKSLEEKIVEKISIDESESKDATENVEMILFDPDSLQETNDSVDPMDETAVDALSIDKSDFYGVLPLNSMTRAEALETLQEMESNAEEILGGETDLPKIITQVNEKLDEIEEPKTTKDAEVDAFDLLNESESLKDSDQSNKTSFLFEKSDADASDLDLIKGTDSEKGRKILKPVHKSGLFTKNLSNINEENVETDFVDDTEDNLTDIMETDPIGEEATDFDSPEENLETHDEKYTITHCSETDLKECVVCKKMEAPKFFGQKQLETIYFCVNECLVKYKGDNPDGFIEKILRLRSFMTQEPPEPMRRPTIPDSESHASNEPQIDCPSDPTRKCGTCKQLINCENYVSWEAIDFCHEGCLLMFQKSISSDCAKCTKPVSMKVTGKYCVRFGNKIKQFCNTACLLSYKKVFKFCTYCQEDLKVVSSDYPNFCSRQCLEMCHPERKVPITGECGVCHKSKPIEIKYQSSERITCFCGDPCFVAYKFVNKVDPKKCDACVTFLEAGTESFHIFVEGIKHSFCSESCQKIYLITNRRIVLCCNCAVKKYNFDMVKLCNSVRDVAYACSNNCLQIHLDKMYVEQVKKIDYNLKQLEAISKGMDFTLDGKKLVDIISGNAQEIRTPIHKIMVRQPLIPPKQRNVGTMCKPNVLTKAVTCKPRETSAHTQTDKVSNHLYVPIPVPIYVPCPVHMYVEPVPVPFPIALPLPVPIFIPTSRKSISGIFKEMQKIRNKVPADPLEAEILMMAEMAAGPKKEESSSDSDQEDSMMCKVEESFHDDADDMDANTSFGEDVLSMAMQMASDFEEPVDLEGVVPPSTIAPQSSIHHETMEATAQIEQMMDPTKRKPRGRKPGRKVHHSEIMATPATITSVGMSMDESVFIHNRVRLDANLNLKFTFGVNAWKQWVTIKNNDLAKSSHKPKLFKPDILQLSADDLNCSLCLFVKEVRKPNGTEYAPDTIYYLCLGIQQFLYENGRIDNIFCDTFYEKFTDTFNEVCVKFANLYDESQYIVTRVEEEHLWESKQLGAHSPLVLLNTLMFFNTKHFSLTTVDEHLQLSFSHIMKHWKRNPHQPGARNVLLRFYPPQNSETRKKKVYEQQENDENPLRCPVKLYEFFLSKCPESVKTRNDVFYLQPERSCVPDSPVWYSTMALDKEPLEKMLNRVKMVKEINVALLTS